MKDLDPSRVDWRLNRGELLQKTLTDHLQFQRDVVTYRSDSPRTHLVPDGDGHASLIVINDVFVAAHKKIVDSLEADLRALGPQGDLMANGVIERVFEPYLEDANGV
jgi:hypothetical protein